MKTHKRIDLTVQAILLVVFAILLTVNQTATLLPTYLEVVGGWQILSLVIHFINRWHPLRGSRRHNFQLVLLALILVMCLMPFFQILGTLFYHVLIVILLLPLYYLWVCFMEVFYYTKRPLELI